MAHSLSIKQTIKALATLCKWRVVVLMLVTAAVGMLLAPKNLLNLSNTIGGILGIGLCACSGGIMNQVFETNIDLKMSRTKHRPLVKNRLSIPQALCTAALFITLGVLVLLVTTNQLTIFLTLGTMIGYGYVYTKILKPLTSQNIVIGGLFGAMPPLLGWCAVTNEVSPFPLLLVAIIYTWTPSHFWSLSLAQIDDYKKSSLPMLPVTHGVACTQVQILLYTILLIVITQLPYVFTYTTSRYCIITNIANVWLLSAMYSVYKDPSHKHCLSAFKRSNLYLIAVFAAMIIDRI
ncbi:MAG: heme o synthase [Pseudomonadota bacterium]|nr:heme o synthase [Pseudomonadota bacterium]